MAIRVLFEEETKQILKEPKMYTVVFHNDDITTMDFVVYVLIEVFGKNTMEATKIMLNIHEKGKDNVGVFTYDIAVSKKSRVDKLSGQKEFPLVVTVERINI